jgi:hypothetical protein
MICPVNLKSGAASLGKAIDIRLLGAYELPMDIGSRIIASRGWSCKGGISHQWRRAICGWTASDLLDGCTVLEVQFMKQATSKVWRKAVLGLRKGE